MVYFTLVAIDCITCISPRCRVTLYKPINVTDQESCLSEYQVARFALTDFSKKQPVSPNGNFVTSISENGKINGLVLASCGMCNFGIKDKKS